MVLFMLCSAVLVAWLLLKPCCVEMCGMLFVMYRSSAFSGVFAITERSEMGLYDVPMFMSMFGFGIGMMFASFYVWRMMLLFSNVLCMLMRYASPSSSMCLRCLMLTLSGPVEFLFFFLVLFCIALNVIFGRCVYLYEGCDFRV